MTDDNEKLLTTIDGEFDEWVNLRNIDPAATIADAVQVISCDTRDFHLGWNFKQPELFAKETCGYEQRTNEGLRAMERMKKDGSISDCEIASQDILAWLDLVAKRSGGYAQSWRYLTARVKHCDGWQLKYLRFVRYLESPSRFIACNSYMHPIAWRKVADAIYDPMGPSQYPDEPEPEPEQLVRDVDEDNLPDHWSEAETTHTLTNPYVWMDTTPPNRRQQFCGPCCNRCQHRFGSTSNSRWCEGHYQQERCYRFKLEKR